MGKGKLQLQNIFSLNYLLSEIFNSQILYFRWMKPQLNWSSGQMKERQKLM